MMRIFMFMLLFLGLASPALAARWQVVQEESAIAFAGKHAGKTFSGRFDGWTADIVFDPAALEASRATVTIDLASATTGDAMYDGTLPGANWFNIAEHPKATFETAAIRRTPKGYVAEGRLSIRGVSMPVALPFTLEINGDKALMDGRLMVERGRWNIGTAKDADPTGEWVSLAIPVIVKVVATRRD